VPIVLPIERYPALPALRASRTAPAKADEPRPGEREAQIRAESSLSGVEDRSAHQQLGGD